MQWVTICTTMSATHKLHFSHMAYFYASYDFHMNSNYFLKQH
jgi:hypothetical protein